MSETAHSPTEEDVRIKIVGAGYRMAWFLSRMVPERWAVRAFDKISLRSWKRNHERRRRLAHNLAQILPAGHDIDAATREAFRWYGRYWLQTFRMQDLSSAELNRRFSIDGIDHIEKAYAAGSGAVFATMHLGNWDAGGRWFSERWPLAVVVEVLRPRALFERFVAHRRALGMEIIPLIRGGDVTAACLQVLAEGRFLALVADRDLSGSGIEVEMFGGRAKLPPGPAVLALRSGAPLIPAVIYMNEDGTWSTRVLEPVTTGAGQGVGSTTQALARSFEQLAASSPTQWHAMFQRYWLDP